jgi:hypothetical protein
MKKNADKYSQEETERRFIAALRGARNVGPLPLKNVPSKRPQKPKKKSKASA